MLSPRSIRSVCSKRRIRSKHAAPQETSTANVYHSMQAMMSRMPASDRTAGAAGSWSLCYNYHLTNATNECPVTTLVNEKGLEFVTGSAD